MYQKEQLEEKLSKINTDEWIALRMIKKCFYGCRGEMPLYIGEKDNVQLNPEYLAHLLMTHGFPPEVLIEEIADRLYKNEEDKKKMIDLYSEITKN